MTCVPNHLLIELGVSRRKFGHFVMVASSSDEPGRVTALPLCQHLVYIQGEQRLCKRPAIKGNYCWEHAES